MKKTIVLILLLIPMLCFAGALQEKHRSVIAKKNVAAGGTDSWGYLTEASTGHPSVDSNLTCSGPYTPPHTGAIKKFYLYSSNTNANIDLKFGVYVNTSDAPGALVGSIVTFTDVGTWSLSWKEFSGFNISVSSTSSYFLCMNRLDSGNLTYYYNGSVTGNHWISKDATYGDAWPDPYGTPGGNLDGYAFSIKVDSDY